MLSDRTLIERQMKTSALVQLHRTLERLSSVLTFMNIGAHPDDEHSGMLAALRFEKGMRLVICCSTRGEGGQNALGSDKNGDLGVIRTREMEESARALDASVIWVGHGMDDPVHDFGFSKNGDDTAQRWGEERLLERVVAAYRRTRPDMVAPTFLDVPGQHGHHRAMTRVAIEAFTKAADPNIFPEQIKAGLAPWQVSKLYLPAISGAGSSYDDQELPPETTLVVKANARDWPTGASFAQLGQQSRYYHATQEMGSWRENQPAEWPLHLALSVGEAGHESEIEQGLPKTLADLSAHYDLPADMAAALEKAQTEIAKCIEAYPNADEIFTIALGIRPLLATALQTCPDDLKSVLAHRIERKQAEVEALLATARGLAGRATLSPRNVVGGDVAELRVHYQTANPADQIKVTIVSRIGLSITAKEIPDATAGFEVQVDSDAPATALFPEEFDSLLSTEELLVEVELTCDGETIRQRMPLEEKINILPGEMIALSPTSLVINTTQPMVTHELNLRWLDPKGQSADIATPVGWTSEVQKDAEAGATIQLTPPDDIKPGPFEVLLSAAGKPLQKVLSRTYSHIGETLIARPAIIRGLTVDAALPVNANVGYVGAGADNMSEALRQIGMPVTDLDADMLLAGDLSQFTTILIGVFGYGKRADLAAARPRINQWVNDGGHLVTMYHRPVDGWDPEKTPPKKVVVSVPSTRWRVTNPNAKIEVLQPDHPLLNYPNNIGAADWAEWHKDRGLYFASSWDDVYKPLLSMADPGEKPLTGSLISAEIGKGRHTHTGLTLHHQMEQQVPGGFRLAANLMQAARRV